MMVLRIRLFSKVKTLSAHLDYLLWNFISSGMKSIDFGVNMRRCLNSKLSLVDKATKLKITRLLFTIMVQQNICLYESLYYNIIRTEK